MNEELQQIIKESSFIINEGRYLYAKVATIPVIDEHFFVSKDQDEITVVTKKENVAQLDLIEKNKDEYSLIELQVAVPFYSVGFLATVSSEIAKAGLNILIVSTYSKDYILVKADKIEKAKQVLVTLGFSNKI